MSQFAIAGGKRWEGEVAGRAAPPAGARSGVPAAHHTSCRAPGHAAEQDGGCNYRAGALGGCQAHHESRLSGEACGIQAGGEASRLCRPPHAACCRRCGLAPAAQAPPSPSHIPTPPLAPLTQPTPPVVSPSVPGGLPAPCWHAGWGRVGCRPRVLVILPSSLSVAPHAPDRPFGVGKCGALNREADEPHTSAGEEKSGQQEGSRQR